ncbi:MAG: glycosyltransferase [Myxococcales bacterium]|nr:glycosyltransferase [Myxococcales bacterium]
MRILLIHSFWHARGGDTTSLQIQREALLARGHQIVAFGVRHPDNLPEPGDACWPGWRDPEPGSWGLAGAVWSPGAARALRRLLERSPPFDVAHVHHLHRHLSPSVLPVLRSLGVPIVWTLHDYELTCPTAHHYRDGAPCFECSGGLLPALRYRCTRSTQEPRPPVARTIHSAALVVEKAVHRASRVTDCVGTFVAPSRYLADRVSGLLGAGRVVHVPNPVQQSANGSPDAAAGARSGVVFAGRMVEEKGVLDVLAIARALPAVTFTLLGEGPLLGVVRAARVANVVAPGAVGRALVWEALARAAAVVVPSRWPENDPYAVTEAQLAGAPVLASRIGGIPEQIDDGVDGILCPPAQPTAWVAPLAALLAGGAMAVEIGGRGHDRVRLERNPDRIAIALEAVYRRSP